MGGFGCARIQLKEVISKGFGQVRRAMKDESHLKSRLALGGKNLP